MLWQFEVTTTIYKTFFNIIKSKNSYYLDSNSLSIEESPSQKNTTIISKKIQLIVVDVPRVSNKFRDTIDEDFISRSNSSTKRPVVLLSITTFVILSFINLERRDVSRIFATSFESIDDDRNTRATIDISIEKAIYSHFIESKLKNPILSSKNFSQISLIIAMSKENIQRIVDRALNNYVQRHSSQLEFSSSKDASSSTELDEQEEDTRRFNSKKVDFFNLKYKKLNVNESATIENINNDIIFRDVYLFVSRIKNYNNTLDVDIVRTNLYLCLQNNALI